MVHEPLYRRLIDRWQLLIAAPHRMFFAAGLAWLVAWSGWWLLLLAARALDLWAMEPAPPALLAHGAAMLYLALPPFMYGFLFTVYPRWMPAPEPRQATMLAVFFLVSAGNLLALLGLALGARVFLTGWLAATAAMAIATVMLGAGLAHASERVSHAYGALAGLIAGLLGMLLFAWLLLRNDFGYWPLVRGLGLWGLLIGVYFTVCHRMIPFFSSRVVPGYQQWRPGWLLASFLALALLRGLLEASPGHAWLASVPLLALAVTCALKWHPRRPIEVRLLAVLHLALLWLPVGIALAVAGDVATALGYPGLVGRAPLHALGMGFVGGMLVAMVTRVTLGHSGRPLAMPTADWRLFLGLQAATLLRLAAEFLPATGPWLSVLAAAAWFGLLAAWALRQLPVYFAPRADGKPG